MDRSRHARVARPRARRSVGRRQAAFLGSRTRRSHVAGFGYQCVESLRDFVPQDARLIDVLSVDCTGISMWSSTADFTEAFPVTDPVLYVTVVDAVRIRLPWALLASHMMWAHVFTSIVKGG